MNNERKAFEENSSVSQLVAQLQQLAPIIDSFTPENGHTKKITYRGIPVLELQRSDLFPVNLAKRPKKGDQRLPQPEYSVKINFRSIGLMSDLEIFYAKDAEGKAFPWAAYLQTGTSSTDRNNLLHWLVFLKEKEVYGHEPMRRALSPLPVVISQKISTDSLSDFRVTAKKGVFVDQSCRQLTPASTKLFSPSLVNEGSLKDISRYFNFLIHSKVLEKGKVDFAFLKYGLSLTDAWKLYSVFHERIALANKIDVIKAWKQTLSFYEQLDGAKRKMIRLALAGGLIFMSGLVAQEQGWLAEGILEARIYLNNYILKDPIPLGEGIYNPNFEQGLKGWAKKGYVTMVDRLYNGKKLDKEIVQVGKVVGEAIVKRDDHIRPARGQISQVIVIPATGGKIKINYLFVSNDILDWADAKIRLESKDGVALEEARIGYCPTDRVAVLYKEIKDEVEFDVDFYTGQTMRLVIEAGGLWNGALGAWIYIEDLQFIKD